MESIRNAQIQEGERIFVRCDLDVPIVSGEIEEKYRLDSAIPTLKLIIDKGAIPVIAGHLGRPDGKFIEELSSAQLKPYFDEKLGAGQYELLENLRFDSREEEGSVEFAKELSQGISKYVNESFANSHREHTSMIFLPMQLPAFAGIRLEEEVSVLSEILKNPTHPLVAIIGGAKLETKKAAVEKFLQIADYVLVGGKVGLIWDLEKPENLILPVDDNDGKDIGPNTINLFKEKISDAKLIIWSGPMGMFEDYEFSEGTRAISEEVSNSSAFTVIGGGDTIAGIRDAGFLESMSFVSVGGGAMLEFLVAGNLTALKAINYDG